MHSEQENKQGEKALRALEHCHYEIDMMVQTCELRGRIKCDSQEDLRVLRNALLESFLTHARSLLDFFENKTPKYPTDIPVCHYGFESVEIAGSGCMRDRINKEISHLTYERQLDCASEKKEWHFDEFTPLFERCREFLEHVCTVFVSQFKNGEVDENLLRRCKDTSNSLRSLPTNSPGTEG